MKAIMHTTQDKLQTFLAFLMSKPKGSWYMDHQTKADKIATLQQRFIGCMRCPLGSQGRTQVVHGEGNPDATLMFVGEGPGRDEDRQGRPFVGRAGQLLNKIIEAMGLKREDLWITNTVKCRPPNNRTPLPEEMATCSSLLLFEEIKIIKPRIICPLGACATQMFLGPKTRLGEARRKEHTFGDIIVMPTYHPAYLLRNPAQKKTVWEDMKRVMKKLSDLT